METLHLGSYDACRVICWETWIFLRLGLPSAQHLQNTQISPQVQFKDLAAIWLCYNYGTTFFVFNSRRNCMGYGIWTFIIYFLKNVLRHTQIYFFYCHCTATGIQSWPSNQRFVCFIWLLYSPVNNISEGRWLYSNLWYGKVETLLLHFDRNRCSFTFHTTQT